ncbi:MAG: hypothetical protein FJX59_21045, partial [Alphaproteobacteria bacterium]|nr:hypothetical protein [Alphaproteobacteria bacterium]
DRTARAMVSHADWSPAARGDRLSNIDLAVTLGRVRGQGPGGFFEGAQAKDVVDAADAAGASLFIEDLRGAVPRWGPVAPEQIDTAAITRTGSAAAGAADAATSLVVTDGEGNAVACALTMNAPFGLGIAARGLGFLFAPAVDEIFDPPLAIETAERRPTLVAAAAGPGAMATLDAARAATDAPALGTAVTSLPGGSHAVVRCGAVLAEGEAACFLHGGP